jgi:hypothetical protein
LTTPDAFVISLFASAPAYPAVDQATLDRLVEYAKAGCLSGNQFDLYADVNGNLTFKNLLKPGAEGKAAVNVRNSPGASAIFDQQLRLVADQQIRDCMKPYIDKIFKAMLGPESGRLQNPFREETGVALGTSTDVLEDRFPNGHFSGSGRHTVFRYTRRINMQDGTHTNFDTELILDHGKVVEATLSAYADYYSGSYKETYCTSKPYVQNLIDWHINLWGTPLCTHNGREGTEPISYFKRENTTATLLTMPAIEHPSMSRRCWVYLYLNSPAWDAESGRCLTEKR